MTKKGKKESIGMEFVVVISSLHLVLEGLYISPKETLTNGSFMFLGCWQ